MTERRALVLTKSGKRMFEQARRRLTDQVTFIDLVPGVDVPSFSPEQATIDAIDAIMARTPFRHVVATSESQMAFAGYLRSRYGLDGLSYDQSLVATNKWRMKQAVRGVYPTARAWLSGDFLEFRGPRPDRVVIKPLASSAARGVRLLPLDAAVRLLSADPELLLVEEALDVSDELHCDGVVRDGRLQWVVVSKYYEPVLLSRPATSASIHLAPTYPVVAEATRAVRQVVPALPARDYVFHMELLRVAGELLFGEVGLRPAGASIPESILRAFGADIWLEFVGMQVGIEQPLSAAPTTRDGLCGVFGVIPPREGVVLRPEDALRLPGITAVVPGTVPPGEMPTDLASFSYYAFFEGLTPEHFSRLMDEITPQTAGQPA